MQDLNTDFLFAKSTKLGATQARIINPKSVITAGWVRLKCQFGCPGYGRSLCCPPNTPTPSQMREVLDCYSRALLLHFQQPVNRTRIVVQLEREAFLNGFYKALGLTAGPCRLCKECDLVKCKNPGETRPSMEACGIDVYATVRSNGFPIEVLKDRTTDPNFYGLVLLA